MKLDFRTFMLVSASFSSILCATSLEQPHHTTAFIAPKNSLDILLSGSYYKTDHFWSKREQRWPTFNRYRQKSYQLYAEFAFTDRDSFFANGGGASVTETMNGSSSSLDDLLVGWKHQLYTLERAAITLQCSAFLPTGQKKSCIRYGVYGFQASLLYSRQFELFNRFAWIDSGAGYRMYHGFPSDSVVAFLALGLQVSSRIYLIATGDVNWAVENGNTWRNWNNITHHPNFSLCKGKVESVIKICSKISLSIGVFRHFIGKSVGAGFGGFCGTWVVF